MIEKIKKISQENQKIIWIIASILLVIGLNMSIDVAQNKIYFNGNEIIWLMICVFLFFILKKANQYKEKRLTICSLVLGILFTIFQILGIMTKGNWIVHEVIFSKKVLLFIIIKFLVYSILFTNIVKIILKYLENINWTKMEKKDLFKPTLKTFLIIAVLFMIAWMPYFLNYYPGITSYDTNYQLMQGYGVQPYSNHHPILHTLIITTIVKIGYAMTNSYNFGIALCAIIQMLACSITFSFVIYYMAKRNIHTIIKTITFLFFAFVPFVPQFSIAIWKDVPFTLCMVWFVIAIIDMVTGEEKLLKSIKYNILFMLLITLLMFFRNNGVYIIILTLPFLIWGKRKYWKRILFLFLLPIVIYYVITGPIYSKLNIEKSSPKEMLSIPIQQMARIVTYRSEELSQEDKEVIAQYIPIERVAELYNPTISDPIKNLFNDGTFRQNKLNLVKLYIKLALKFPGETLEALVGNTYGYYYPEVVTYSVATGTYTSPFENEQFMDIHLDPIIKIPFIDNMITAIYDKEIPIISLLANMGFAFWIFMLLITYCIYQKKYSCLLPYVPIIILYLTCLASPVSGELRYIYSMFTCLPLFIGFSLKSIDKE